MQKWSWKYPRKLLSTANYVIGSPGSLVFFIIPGPVHGCLRIIFSSDYVLILCSRINLDLGSYRFTLPFNFGIQLPSIW